ncbi:MAG TPA: ribonuclease H, partial [Candidatus Binataceae bacterium]|nr:ribonuclease H [Candidatus Binataceae bacterium]
MSKLADRIIVYADGSCLGNPGPGGWGAVILDGRDAPELSGSNPQTTNNRMEITAVIEALRALPASTHALIRTDSQYVIKTITDGWRRNKNQDLWALLDAELRGRDVRFEWVKGHADDPMNERADALAREAAGGALTRAARSLAPSPRAEP